MDDVVFAGADRQARLIRSREVSSRELVGTYLDRIARLDPVLNAYRVVLGERALAEAAQADARAAAGDDRPLLGVPVAVKDDCDVAGEATLFGTDAAEGAAAADAEVVRRLRAAGAVVLGKTHVPELGITPFTESPVYGVTRNPWDPRRTSGGSSGGSATAVAAGLAGAALGSDGAGSIRIPAGCCGLFGLKATRGRVPAAGFRGLSSFGPLTRRVADSALLYDAIREGGAPWSGATTGPLRVAVSVGPPPFAGVRPDAEQLDAVRRVADALRGLGHAVVERELAWPAPVGLRTVARYLRGIADRAGELPHPERLSRRARGFVRLGRLAPEAVVARAQAAAPADARAFPEGVDLVLTPMFTRRPPRVGEYEGRGVAWTLAGELRLVPYCGPFNHTGQPAASVPAGWTADGFPLAAQLVAREDRETTLLAVAAQLEEAIGWAERRPAL